MRRMTITRRHLLTTGMKVTAAWVLAGNLAFAAGKGQTGLLVTFHDPRFPRSRRLARALPGATALHGVHGDPSQLLARIASGRPGRQPWRLQGVTTETIPFCLEQFARGYHDVHFENRRIDRDLFAWSLTLSGRPATH